MNLRGCPEFVSDLLPAAAEALSLGIVGKSWLKAVFEGRDLASDTFGRVVASAKMPSDDSGFPSYAVPYVELDFENPIGTVMTRMRWRTLEQSLRGMAYDYWDGLAWNPFFIFDLTDPDFTNWWVLIGGKLIPSSGATYDLGLVDQRWRSIFQGGFLFLGDIDTLGITLPNPSVDYRLSGIGDKGGAGIKDDYKMCRKRTADDYKWLDLLDRFQSVSLLKESAGVTRVNIGTAQVEILPASMRSKADLAYFDRCRVVFGGVSNEAEAFRCQVQYSSDQLVWSALTSEASSDGTLNEQVVVGQWGSVPSSALTDVYVRAVGRAATAEADPTYRSIELQLK